ncbi:hypothetical protein ACIBH1_03785 [Nonomuraea sp. NPDC050663]|uniref:hypothetical protein n=1 Tax=Nonomuraea sp. NPDC050663 TaxID=3364370 RepID=UPI00378AA220
MTSRSTATPARTPEAAGRGRGPASPASFASDSCHVLAARLALRPVPPGRAAQPSDLRDFLAGQRQLGLDPAGAAALLDDLAARGLIGVGDDGLTRTTQEGDALHTRLSETIAPITGRVFGDFDPAELEVAHRVLNEVMRRADEVRAGL